MRKGYLGVFYPKNVTEQAAVPIGAMAILPGESEVKIKQNTGTIESVGGGSGGGASSKIQLTTAGANAITYANANGKEVHAEAGVTSVSMALADFQVAGVNVFGSMYIFNYTGSPLPLTLGVGWLGGISEDGKITNDLSGAGTLVTIPHTMKALVIFDEDMFVRASILGSEVTTADVTNMFNVLENKTSVRASTTANITLSGIQTVDGVVLVAGNRVLVKNQSTGSQNGIYVVSSTAWTRSTDADGVGELKSGTNTYIEEGTLNAKTYWTMTNTGAIAIGTTSLVFEKRITTATDAPYIPDWVASTSVRLSEVRRATVTIGSIKIGSLIRSGSARTTGATFDATESTNWTMLQSVESASSTYSNPFDATNRVITLGTSNSLRADDTRNTLSGSNITTFYNAGSGGNKNVTGTLGLTSGEAVFTGAPYINIGFPSASLTTGMFVCVSFTVNSSASGYLYSISWTSSGWRGQWGLRISGGNLMGRYWTGASGGDVGSTAISIGMHTAAFLQTISGGSATHTLFLDGKQVGSITAGVGTDAPNVSYIGAVNTGVAVPGDFLTNVNVKEIQVEHGRNLTMEEAHYYIAHMSARNGITQDASCPFMGKIVLPTSLGANIPNIAPVLLTESSVSDWAASKMVFNNELRRATVAIGSIAIGDLIRSNGIRLTTATFDATEATNWTVVGGLGKGQSPIISDWAASTVVRANEMRRITVDIATVGMPIGSLIRSNSARTTGTTFDATEALQWTSVVASSGVFSVVGTTNLNTLITNGLWASNTSNIPTNGPPMATAQYWTLRVIRTGGTARAMQTLHTEDNHTFTRVTTDEGVTWTAWRKLDNELVDWTASTAVTIGETRRCTVNIAGFSTGDVMRSVLNRTTGTTADATELSTTNWQIVGKGFCGVHATALASQSFPSSFGSTTIQYSTEEYDTHSFHDNVTNNSRFYAPTTGYYSFVVYHQNASSTSSSIQGVSYMINGGSVIQLVGGSVAADVAGTFSGSDVVIMNAGSYIEFVVLNLNSGGLATTTFAGRLAITKIG